MSILDNQTNTLKEVLVYMITKEELRTCLPANLRGAATDDLAYKINSICADPIIAKEIGENFISFATVLQEGKFKMDDYLNAVAFVTYTLMGRNNREAYAATFPERIRDMTAAGYDERKISSYVAMYNKGKLVNLIREQSLIPVWVLNAHNFQKAIDVQAELMINAKSEMVRATAANSLLTHLQKPKEAANLQLNINTGNESSAMDALADALNKLSSTQEEVIREGKFMAKDIASKPIIEGEYEDVPN